MKTTIIALQILGASLAFKFFGLSIVIVLTGTYVILGCLDVFTGYFKNPTSERTSARLSLGITTRVIKLILIAVITLAVAHALTFLQDGSYAAISIGLIPIIVVFSYNLSEIKSLAENLKVMGVNDPLTLAIPGIVDRVFKLGSDFLGNALDKFSKYIATKIEKKGDLPDNQ